MNKDYFSTGPKVGTVWKSMPEGHFSFIGTGGITDAVKLVVSLKRQPRLARQRGKEYNPDMAFVSQHCKNQT